MIQAKSHPETSSDAEKRLRKALAEQILILDGAMGTMIQEHKLGEADIGVIGLQTGLLI